MHRDRLLVGPAWARTAAMCGLASVVLVVLNVFVLSGGGGPPPNPSTPPSQLAAFAAQRRVTVELGYYLDALGTVLLLVFALIVARRAEAPGWLWSTLLLCAAVLYAAVDMVWAAATYALRELAHVGTSADGVVALFFLSQATLWIISLPYGLLFAAFGALALQTRVLPAPLGWLSLPIALIVVVSTLPFPAMKVAIFPLFGLSLLWIVVASVVLLLRPATWSEPAPAVNIVN